MTAKKKKYLLCYLKTGGGHLAPAKAIYNYINEFYSESAEPKLIYGFENTPRWAQFIVEDGYRILQYTGKWFFEFLYAVNKIPFFGKWSCKSVSFYMKKYLEKTILEENPDTIAVFHFFLLKPINEIIKKHKLTPQLYIVITDPFTPHPMWFFWNNKQYIAFSESLKNKIQKKLNGSKVYSFPFVLDNKFSVPLENDTVKIIKKKLGFSDDKKIVLILGGGDGIPRGRKILNGLLKEKTDAQIVIVCGKNKSLMKEAKNLKKKYNAHNLTIYGYIDFVYELINISDVVITKCGASTIMEILNLHKVPVVNDYIWEQEQGNIDYLINKRLGIYEPKLKNIPGVVKELLSDENKYSMYRQNILNENVKNGVKEVTEFLINN